MWLGVWHTPSHTKSKQSSLHSKACSISQNFVWYSTGVWHGILSSLICLFICSFSTVDSLYFHSHARCSQQLHQTLFEVLFVRRNSVAFVNHGDESFFKAPHSVPQKTLHKTKTTYNEHMQEILTFDVQYHIYFILLFHKKEWTLYNERLRQLNMWRWGYEQLP